jgi:hypothetical protein
MLKNRLNKAILKGKGSFKDIWVMFKTESFETKIAVVIITEIIKGRKVSKEEILFLKAHSKDLMRIIPLIALQGIPLPIPFTLIVILISKKYNIDILPKNNLKLLEKNNEKL